MSDLNNIIEMIKRIGTKGYRDGSSTDGGYLYHPIPFKEFNKFLVHKKSAPSEWQVILDDYGSVDGKKILDIGCANGFFSFNASMLGANIVAYEGDKLVYDVDEAIRKYKVIDNIKFVNKYFDDNVSMSIADDFDIAIMMNVHMWIYKQIGAERTMKMMRDLSSKVGTLYFQTSHKKSRGMFKVRELEDRESIEKYLFDCGFSDVIHLKRWEKGSNRKREMFKCLRKK